MAFHASFLGGEGGGGDGGGGGGGGSMNHDVETKQTREELRFKGTPEIRPPQNKDHLLYDRALYTCSCFASEIKDRVIIEITLD